MRSAAFVQLGRIGLHPTPDAAGVHFDTTLGHQFGDVLVGERIPEIPAHAQNDHLSRVLAPFERIVRVDRHGILPYQDAGSKVRNETAQRHGSGEPADPRVTTGDGAPASINGGLTRREYPGQPISVGIEVPAVDACTDLVGKCGGKTLVGKVGLPGVAWFAVCQDSEGNTFAIFQPDPAAR
jgi:predicted enzyme related to lactoylglutathione lyase